MALKFKPLKSGAPRDLVDLKSRLGGDIGTLSIPGHKQPVLRLAENTYVGQEKPAGVLRMALGEAKTDLHVVKTNADLFHFAARWRQFKGESHGSKAERP